MDNNQFNSTIDVIETELTKLNKSYSQQNTKTSVVGLSLFPLFQKFVEKSDGVLIDSIVREMVTGVSEKQLQALIDKIKLAIKNPRRCQDSSIIRLVKDVLIKQQRFENLTLKPSGMLVVINSNRKKQGLKDISKSAGELKFANWKIDEDIICPVKNTNDSTILETAKKVVKNLYGYEVEIDSTTDSSTIKGKKLKFGSKGIEDSILISANLILNAVYNSCNCVLSKDITDKNLPGIDVAQKSWKNLTQQAHTELARVYKNVMSLFSTSVICAVSMPTESYRHLSKVIDYQIGQNLYTIANNVNCEAVGYLIAKSTLTTQKQLLAKLGYTQQQLLEKLEKVGCIYENEVQINSLIECLTKIEAITLDISHIEKGYKVDFDKVIKEEHYKTFINKYKMELNNIKQDDDQNISFEDLTNKKSAMVEKLSKLKREMENVGYVQPSQLKKVLEIHAYCTVALEIVNGYTPSKDKEQEIVEIVTPIEQTITPDINFVSPEIYDYIPVEGFNNIDNNNQSNNVVEVVEENQDDIPVVNSQEEGTPNEVIDVEPEIVDEEIVDNIPAENIDNAPVNEEVVDNTPAEQPVVTPKKKYVKPEYKQYTLATDQSNNTKAPVSENVASDETVNVAPKSVNNNTKKSNTTTKKPKPKTVVKVVRKEDTEMNKLQEEIELLKQSNQALLNKVEELSKNSVSSEDLKAQKLERLKQKFQEIIKNNLTKSISSLANKNLEEIGNKLVYSTNQYSRDCATLLAGLNLLISMQDGDKTVRNMFVALNRPNLVRSLMLLKDKLNTTFVQNFASQLAQNAMECDENNSSYEQIMHDTLVKMNNRFTYMLKDQCQTEIDMVQMMYAPDSFEYQDEVDSIKAKYFGDEEHYGLMQQLDKCLLGTIIKDVIFTEIKRIDNCDISAKKYELNDRIIDQRIGEMFMKFSQDEEQLTF